MKLTKVTLLQTSGVNIEFESLVIMNRLKVLTKSISESPTLINILPPVLYNSLLRTVVKIGSIFSTS